MSVQVDIIRNQVGDWEVFCYGNSTSCMLRYWSQRAWLSQDAAVNEILHHMYYDHRGQSLQLEIKPCIEEPPSVTYKTGRHAA